MKTFFRKHDYFTDLAAPVNEVVDHTRSDIMALEERIGEMEAMLADLSDTSKRDALMGQLNQLKELVNQYRL